MRPDVAILNPNVVIFALNHFEGTTNYSYTLASSKILSLVKMSPRRLFLVSVPRTASNLLVKVLNIHNQPNVFTNDKAGYFFYEAYITATDKGYFNKPIDRWTDAEKTDVHNMYRRCLERLESASEQAQRDEKIMFTKEHAFWFANPAMMLDADSPGTSSKQQQQQQQDADYFRLSWPGVPGGPHQNVTFSQNNKTIFPDEYLRTWQFIFLIRHPALAWPSMYRAMQKLSQLGFLDDDGIRSAMATNMTLKWTRYLVNWCSEQAESQTVPLIIDAHDLLHSRDVVLRFCQEAGLDENMVQFEWDDGKESEPKPGPTPQGLQDTYVDPNKKAVDVMTSTLRTSTGVIKDKTPAAIDIDAEAEKWKDEFGSETAALLEKMVMAAMPDYEYLKERSLKV